jgi:hypothetical protein
LTALNRNYGHLFIEFSLFVSVNENLLGVENLTFFPQNIHFPRAAASLARLWSVMISDDL